MHKLLMPNSRWNKEKHTGRQISTLMKISMTRMPLKEKHNVTVVNKLSPLVLFTKKTGLVFFNSKENSNFAAKRLKTEIS